MTSPVPEIDRLRHQLAWHKDAVEMRGLEIEHLRVALKYYADPEIVIGRIVDGKIVGDSNGGETARTALRIIEPGHPDGSD